MSTANELLVSSFEQHDLTTGFLLTLFSTQELALAVNLQRKYAVQFEVSQHGIFCDTWLAHRNAQHDSHRQLACFYTQASAHTQLAAITDHLTALLQECAQGRTPVDVEDAQSLTDDDTLWLKTVMKGLERCVAGAEKTGLMITVGEIRGLIEAVNEAKAQGGAS